MLAEQPNISIDMWYGDDKEITFYTCRFYDCDIEWRGNLFNSELRCIGDYCTNDSAALYKWLSNFRQKGC